MVASSIEGYTPGPQWRSRDTGYVVGMESATSPTSQVAVTTPPCMNCGTTSTVIVDVVRLASWKAGALTQLAFDNLDAATRELLISGIHPDCWQQMLGNAED